MKVEEVEKWQSKLVFDDRKEERDTEEIYKELNLVRTADVHYTVAIAAVNGID